MSLQDGRWRARPAPAAGLSVSAWQLRVVAVVPAWAVPLPALAGITMSPTATSVTPLPVASTRPTPSLPGTAGSAGLIG